MPSEPRILRVRWIVAAPAQGCRWCGYLYSRHWSPMGGTPAELAPGLCERPHTFTSPTPAQIDARRAARLRHNLTVHGGGPRAH